MSSINGVGNPDRSGPVQKIINNPIQKEIPANPADASAPSRPADKLELSGMSHLLKTLKTNDVRLDKVAQIKAQIEAGTYETEDKLDVAADRLLDELEK
jgi:negative regulator of flagellin synthesis FlgM